MEGGNEELYSTHALGGIKVASLTPMNECSQEETDNDKLGELAEQLCELVEEIERLELESEQEKQAAAARASAGTGGTSTTSEESGPKPITRADIEALGAETVAVLDGLGLSKPPRRLGLRLSELSGGWRMRAALAQVLVSLDQIDVLLLDEPTNHLDLPSIAWLQDFLAESKVIVMLVSHDRAFLDAVSTDIVELKNQKLVYFPGSYEDYLLNKEEMVARKMNALDVRARKESHLQKAIENVKARGDDSAVRSKQKKLERAAFTRALDGHRYKLFSLQKMEEKSIHMPEVISSGGDGDQRVMKFKFPAVDASSLRLASADAPLLTMENCTLAYVAAAKKDAGAGLPAGRNSAKSGSAGGNSAGQAVSALLQDITLQLTLRSRVGIIGRNGKGKSSLLYALAYAESLGPVSIPGLDRGEHAETGAPAGAREGDRPLGEASAKRVLALTVGHIWRHHNLRIGVVAQHQIDILSEHLWSTPMEYLAQLVQQYNQQLCGGSSGSTATSSSASAAASAASGVDAGSGGGIKYTELELRAHLGSFGLSGNLALQKIGSLSGGQKSRLSFAAVCVLRPHLLFLDEPSNHLSMESIEALIKACEDYAGGIVVVSHNRYFLSRVCNELFVVAPHTAKASGGKAGGSTGSKASGSKAASVAGAGAGAGAATISVRRADAAASGSSSSKQEKMSFDDLLSQAIQEQMQS